MGQVEDSPSRLAHQSPKEGHQRSSRVPRLRIESGAMANLNELTEAVKKGNRNEATRITREAIESQTPPGEILQALITGMDDVGRRFKANEIFVPEVLIAAR